ncbi:MAG: hypothetical protein P8183_12060, partial [Anaerolineae bacterium]
MFESRNRRKSTFAYFLSLIYVNRQYIFTVGYYVFLVFMTMAGIAYGYYFSNVFFASDKPLRIQQVMNELKLLWLVPLPYAILNFYSFVRYPITLRPRFHAVPLWSNQRFASIFYFRYVTRGQNPKLVAENVERAYHLLQRIL